MAILETTKEIKMRKIDITTAKKMVDEHKSVFFFIDDSFLFDKDKEVRVRKIYPELNEISYYSDSLICNLKLKENEPAEFIIK